VRGRGEVVFVLCSLSRAWRTRKMEKTFHPRFFISIVLYSYLFIEHSFQNIFFKGFVALCHSLCIVIFLFIICTYIRAIIHS
jgi:hypothetical protein